MGEDIDGLVMEIEQAGKARPHVQLPAVTGQNKRIEPQVERDLGNRVQFLPPLTLRPHPDTVTQEKSQNVKSHSTKEFHSK